MRGLLVVLIASVAGALMPAVAASAATRHLVGYVEAAHQSPSTHRISAAGWAADTNRPDVSVHVSVWVDGKRAVVILANVGRPDINSAHHLTGKHGFHVTLAWKTVAKSVVIRPYNATTPDAGSRRVTQDPVPPAGTRIITEAKKYLGLHNPGYVFGGTSPVTGFDCSGYTAYLYRVTHVANLVAYTETQRRAVRLIPVARALPGDLVFYMAGGSSYHVAVYAGHGMQYAAATEQDGIVYQHVWSADVQYGTTWH